MRVRSVLVPLAVAAFAATNMTGCAYVAVGPTAPAATDPPATVTTVTVPSSWSVPVAPGTACANNGTQPVTFGQNQWNDYLTGIATSLQLPNPATATITGLDIKFPAGCYYTSSTVRLDNLHALVDVSIDGAFTNDPALSPQIVQTNVPACADGSPMLSVASAATNRLELVGLTVTGSAPATMPYCGGGSAALSIGAGSGTGPHQVTVRSNTLQNNWGDNLYIAQVDRLDAEGNTMLHAGRTSTSQVAGNDVVFKSNTMEWAAGAAYQIESNTNGPSVERVLVANNHGSYSNSAGTGTYRNNGLLWSATAAPGTEVADVQFLNNTSDSALLMWLMSGGTGATAGAVHRIAFTGNTTSSNAGEIHLYSGDNISLTNNKILGGPPVALVNGDRGSNWTTDPPRMLVAIPPKSAAPVCGSASGNTFTNSAGASVPFSIQSTDGATNVGGYVMTACP